MNPNIKSAQLPPLWKSLYHDRPGKLPIKRGLVIDIQSRNFGDKPRQLLVVSDPLLYTNADSEVRNNVLRLISAAPLTGPNDEQLKSIGVIFFDPKTIPEPTVKTYWTAECEALEPKRVRGERSR